MKLNGVPASTQRSIAGAIILVGFFFVVAAVLWGVQHFDWRSVTQEAAALLGSIVGAVLTHVAGLAKDYTGWLFGSSVGSERKTELMNGSQHPDSAAGGS